MCAETQGLSWGREGADRAGREPQVVHRPPGALTTRAVPALGQDAVAAG